MSVTARQGPAVKRAIATIPEDAWMPIEYTDAVFDEQARTWISNAEVAEAPFTAFTSRPKKDHTTGRLVVRRIPRVLHHLDSRHGDRGPGAPPARDHRTGQRGPQACSPGASAGLKTTEGIFTANAAWLVLAVIAFNLSRAAATIAGAALAKATTATIRRKLITVPARIASSGRRTRLHLPHAWPWEAAWTTLFAHTTGPPQG